MAPPRKRPDQRQDNREGRRLTVLAGGRNAGDRPPAGRSWRKAVTEAWDAFWAGDAAEVVQPEHHHAVRRLFDLRDLQARAFEQYRKRPFVDGSMGQPVTNPAFADAMKLEAAIVALEDRFGLTPKARANLGVAIDLAALTAADLNRMAETAASDLAATAGWTTVD